MSIAQSLLPEFDNEVATTRKVLERVPFDKITWKPHPKSGTMGWLASHVAGIVGWCKETFTRSELDLAPDGKQPAPDPVPASQEELLAKFDKCVAAGREALAAATDEQMMGTWKLLMTGREILALPRIAVYRGFVMNHMIHHRGALSVYLRLCDVPVPSIYGPSADEPNF